MSRYRKFVASLVGGFLSWAGVVITSPAPRITSAEWLILATALAVSAGVYHVPNE